MNGLADYLTIIYGGSRNIKPRIVAYGLDMQYSSMFIYMTNEMKHRQKNDYDELWNICGEFMINVIDESNFVKRKNKRGRVLAWEQRSFDKVTREDWYNYFFSIC